MNDREKLVGLMKAVKYPVFPHSDNMADFGVQHSDHVFEAVADHLIANGVILLPCTEGATVFEVSNNTEACHDCNCFSSFYGMDSICDIADGEDRYYPDNAKSPICEKQFMHIVAHTPDAEWIFRHRAEFGKTVFLTHAEAVHALET